MRVGRPGRRGIYLAGSISGGRQSAPQLARIAAAVEARGYVVLSKPVLDPSADQVGASREKHRAIFRRDIGWIAQCAAMIAEVSVPSLGVGYEICEALHCAKPVLCLRQKRVRGQPFSAMIGGNTSSLLRLAFYTDEDIGRVVGTFLADLEAGVWGA